MALDEEVSSSVSTQEQQVVKVCSVVELPPGEIRRAQVNPPVAVYNVDGELYATADLCTHDKSSLSEEGYLDGDQVECGWHMAKFCVRNGAVTAPPATQPLVTYEVRVENGEVYVVVNAPAT